MPNKVRIFQVGFNKCATTSLYKLFLNSGCKPLHGGGRFWRAKNHPALAKGDPQLTIHNNIENGRPPIEGLEDFDVFFDMEFIHNNSRVENFKAFKDMATAYPNAKFILNTRDKHDWLMSRVRHNDGRYLSRTMKFYGLDRDEAISTWSEDFDRHHANVRDYFANEPHRLLEFDIDRSDIADLAEFIAPEFEVDLTKWTRHRVTDVYVKAKGWKDNEKVLGLGSVLAEI